MVDPMGSVLLIAGIIFAVRPYEVAKFGEYLNAIGSERPGHFTDPTDLNVTLTRFVGVGSAIIGLVGLLANW